MPLVSKASSLHSSAKSFAFSPFLKIGTDNTIEIILSKIEMGQGIWTTLPMLIAEELDCDWKKITVRHSPPGSAEDGKTELALRSTGGSDTTRSEFDRYRTAGATAREMLIRAAQQLFPEIKSFKTENGFIVSGEKKIPYGDLVSKASQLPVPEVTLRPAVSTLVAECV